MVHCVKENMSSMKCMSIWNNEELPQQGKESIIVPIYKNCDKTGITNCIGISVLSISLNIYPTLFSQGLNIADTT
jgi:hypothetical protein